MRVYDLVSRNKDNRGVEGFVQRHKVFMSDKEPTDSAILNKFYEFVAGGVEGEFARLYCSVNERDVQKAKKAFLCALISNDNIPMNKLDTEFCSIAARPENALTKKWMFDFDSEDVELLGHFMTRVCEEGQFELYEIEYNPTPHGYAVITPRGFDTRKLMAEFKDCVELKRDAALCTYWARKAF